MYRVGFRFVSETQRNIVLNKLYVFRHFAFAVSICFGACGVIQNCVSDLNFSDPYRALPLNLSYHAPSTFSGPIPISRLLLLSISTHSSILSPFSVRYRCRVQAFCSVYSLELFSRDSGINGLRD